MFSYKRATQKEQHDFYLLFIYIFSYYLRKNWCSFLISHKISSSFTLPNSIYFKVGQVDRQPLTIYEEIYI